MEQLRPIQAEQPQCAAAFGTEIPLAGADLTVNAGTVDSNGIPTLDLESPSISCDIDRVSAAALRLAADRTVAPLIRYRLRRPHPIPHRAAMA